MAASTATMPSSVEKRGVDCMNNMHTTATQIIIYKLSIYNQDSQDSQDSAIASRKTQKGEVIIPKIMKICRKSNKTARIRAKP